MTQTRLIHPNPPSVAKTLRRSRLGRAIVSLVFATLAPATFAADPAEIPIGVAPEPASVVIQTLSTDCRHVAIVLRNDGSAESLIVDGKTVANEEDIRGVALSGDGRRLAYVVKNLAGWHVTLDGQPQRVYGQILGPDVKGRPTAQLYFSPDGKRLAYFAGIGGDAVPVLDGREQNHYRRAGDWVWSDDSQHWALSATVKSETYGMTCVCDGKEGKLYSGLLDVQFAPGAIKPSYMASNGEEDCVVINGVQGPYGGDVKMGTLAFSPDGKHTGYAVQVDNSANLQDVRTETDIIKDGEKIAMASEGSLFRDNLPFIDHLVLSTSGRRLAYEYDVGIPMSARRGQARPQVREIHLAGRPAMTASNDRVVVDDKTGPIFDLIGQIVFSPDEKHVAYGVVAHDKWHIEADGKALADYDDIQNLSFSRDSQHLIYVGLRAGKWRLVVDDRELTQYDLVVPRFGDDLLAIDDDHFRPSLCLSDDAVDFVAVRDGKLMAVHLPIQERRN